MLPLLTKICFQMNLLKMNREDRLLEIREQYYQAAEEHSKAMGDPNNRGHVFPEFYFLIDFRRTYERLQALRWDGADHPG